MGKKSVQLSVLFIVFLAAGNAFGEGVVSGNITGAIGQPLKSVCMLAFQTLGQEMPDAIAITDEVGNYSLTLAEGSFYLLAHPSCVESSYHIPRWWNGTGGTFYADLAVPIEIQDGQQQSDIDFSLEEGGTFSGRVTDATETGIEGITVMAWDADVSWAYWSDVTDSNGDYKMAAIYPGNYRVHFDAKKTGYGSKWYNNQLNQADADFIQVVANTNNGGIDAQLEPGGAITGRVIDTSNNGLEGIMVFAVDAKTDGFVA